MASSAPQRAFPIAFILLAWAATVVVASASGFLYLLPGPAIAGLVALGVSIPAIAYFRSPALQHRAERFGLRIITLFHAWRIVAALLFFHFGAQGLLPERFVLHAAWGDLIAGFAALLVVALPFSRSRYWAMHLFGMADFLLAVGTGLYFTLVASAEMDAIRELPLALIPLFGVALSGASHLIAFDLLRRGRGLPDQPFASITSAAREK